MTGRETVSLQRGLLFGWAYSSSTRNCLKGNPIVAIPFGNDLGKLERYRSFWRRDPVSRPLTGFTFVGWFPLGEFAIARRWAGVAELTPEMLDPLDSILDHERMVREGESVDDDLIRGAAPMQMAVPFLPGMLGCKLRILPGSILGDERLLSWEQAEAVALDMANPWYKAYFRLAQALVERAQGRFPVSHNAEIGPTDLHAVLRGHTRALEDLVFEPERTARLLGHMADIFCELTEALWRRLPLFHGGWFDAQYNLWAPGPIARLQEDASAVLSPRIYRDLVAPSDRMLASWFPCAFMHLHSTSMFLLEEILAIQELQCFEINRDETGPPLVAMVPYFRRVQKAGRSLVIRGSFTPDELRALLDSLDPCGLMLIVMVREQREIDVMRRIVGM
jgi:hypothetical protein